MLVITKGYMIYDGIFHGIHVDVHVFFALNIDVQVPGGLEELEPGVAMRCETLMDITWYPWYVDPQKCLDITWYKPN